MMPRKVVMIVGLILMANQSFAQNLDDSDSMFPAKTDSSLIEQAVIGVGEYILFNALHVKEHGLTPLKNQMDALDLEKIESAQQQLADPKSKLNAEQRASLKAEILAAEDSLVARQVRQASNLEKAQLRAKGVRRLMYSGQALIVVDLFGRAYVWNKLDRDPGITPIATFVLKSVSGQ